MNQEGSKGLAPVNGTSLYYEDIGVGPALVLIPGYTLDTRMWDDQMEAFSQRYRVIRYDLRGTGQSAIPSGESYAYHEDLKALLESLGIERAHILGFSLGGAIAVDFALAYPQRTHSLIAVDVSGLDGFEWPEELDRWFTAIRAAASNGDIEQAKALWLGTGWFVPALSQPEVAARLKQLMNGYSGWHFANDNPVRSAIPATNERLGEIIAPTLVMVGELDLPFYNHRIADRLVQGIRGAKKVIIPGVGHMSNMEDPQTFNRIVLDFLADHQS